ncbi:hypothetical protein GLAREA_09764 [Glarea lozoyensis ATCC 20868]|uniref:AMP-activated protein kinase glycogen-binding domain-containing protein n=1 Tax=Glarea lozoyensis (strain ATCC 20868 / MF5171) TaxID=1116229 RepID=S3DQ80_GLAL2|nr:uncharacterized protein GLAREA_09764 [Glarea lozoyensis ATCC 20868]EPE28643.1 hypothetical protein GLAREA_09764 [Glarea lozoyensis ATCC 20868]
MATSDRTSTVTIRFSTPGTQPPIYLAGSFSHPEWDPQEMEHKTKADGELEFTKEVEVQEGKQYQYKFRVGEGEWWVLNEEAPTVTDNIGNRNNLLSVPADYVSSAEFQQGKKNTDIPSSPNEDSESTDIDTQTPVKTNTKVVGNVADNLVNGSENLDKNVTEDSVPEIRQPTNTEAEAPPTKEPVQSPFAAKHTPRIDALQAEDSEAREGARTPDIANVAAEVAETAAFLDRGQSTPPISDEEAGRIGYRRLSNTPIPEVASTAAEVADVAAKLDENIITETEYTPNLNIVDDDDEFDYPPTPEEDRVPLFPHECPGPTDKVADSLESRRLSSPSTLINPAHDLRANFNDPTLVRFPTDRDGVFAQIHTLERQLPPDNTLPGSPGSPAIGTIASSRSFERLDMPSPRLLGNSSPSLHAISEDQELDNVSLNTRRHRNSALRSVSSMQDLNEESGHSIGRKSSSSEPASGQDGSISKAEAPISSAADEIKKPITDDASSESVIHHKIPKPTPNPNPLETTANKKELPSEQKSKSDIDTTPSKELLGESSPISPTDKSHAFSTENNKDMPIASQSPPEHLSINSDGVPDDSVPEAKPESSRPSLMERRQGSSRSIKDFTLGGSQTDSGGDQSPTTDQPTIEIDHVSPRQSPGKASPKAGNSLFPNTAPAVATPFIVGGERQLGHGQQDSVNIQGPTITLQEATPRSSLRPSEADTAETLTKGESSATSTNEGNSELVSRKKQKAVSPTADRPLTPNSMPSNKEVKSRNFLKAFWRVVFVDWIGGFITRLCGGRRDA